MTAVNDKIIRLTSRNVELNSKNEKLEHMVINVENFEQEVEYLKNKVLHAE